MYAESAAVAGSTALAAADGAIDNLGEIIGSVARLDEYFLPWRPLLLAVRAESPREPLSKHAVDRDETRNGSTPISVSRVIAPAASFV